tara:strand:+ start:3339 stop:3554 length:216 start_codon:yes stop_codon:yes gene_type:complete
MEVGVLRNDGLPAMEVGVLRNDGIPVMEVGVLRDDGLPEWVLRDDGLPVTGMMVGGAKMPWKRTMPEGRVP